MAELTVFDNNDNDEWSNFEGRPYQFEEKRARDRELPVEPHESKCSGTSLKLSVCAARSLTCFGSAWTPWWTQKVTA